MQYKNFMTCVLVLTTASVSLADQVSLKNGDRVSGKIVKKDGDSLVVKSDLMGEVKIPWASVTSVSTDEPLVVVLPDGKTVTGKLSTAGEKVEIATATAKEQIPLANLQGLRNAAEQKEYERYLNPRLVDLWAGYIDFSLATATGNAQTTSITTAFNAARVTKADKTTLYFNQIYGTAKLSGRPSETTAQAVRGGLAYNRNVSSRLFVNVFNDYEYDRFQNLDLRFVLGGGLGFSVIKSERSQLDLLGGLAYNREKFVLITRNSAEGFWGDDWSYKLNGISSLKQSFRMFNNIY